MSSLLDQFHKDGFYVVENLLTDEECDKLRSACKRVIDEMNPSEHICLFDTNPMNPATVAEEYFLKSGDCVRFFFEPKAVDEKKRLIVDKHLALNKIGHALHWWVPEFKEVTFNDAIKKIFRDLGFVRPAIPQSMYIFKQPHIGGEVSCHQDATFLHTNPENKVVGIWIALEDATVENGCLKFIPGSHKHGIENGRKMVRKSGAIGAGEPLLELTSPLQDHPDSEFIDVPVKKGSAIIIDGLVIHKSAPNVSDKSRHIYTFHCYETHNVEWSSLNWQQPTDRLAFPVLYDDRGA